MTFVFDLDDTICETNEFSKEFIDNFIAENNWSIKQIEQTTRFAEAKYNWTTEQANNWYKIYGDEMALLFPCKPFAVEFINSLYDQGHRIIIATARDIDWHTNPVALTKLWLAKNKIKHTKLYIKRLDKELICEEENADFFIDDDLKTTARVAEHFKKIGGNCKSMLMTSEYNNNKELPEGVTRILDFYDFAEKLKEYDIDIEVAHNC